MIPIIINKLNDVTAMVFNLETSLYIDVKDVFRYFVIQWLLASVVYQMPDIT